MIHKMWLASSRIGVLVATLAVAAFLVMPRLAFAGEEAMILATDPARLTVETKTGTRSFAIEIAKNPAERSAGLMFRETMQDDHGMLFVFERPQVAAFWMKNTPMALDLVFIRQDGRIAAIRRGEPQSEAVISPGTEVRFVLELKAGTAARESVAAGDLVKHPAIVAASDGP
ncbi:DUF192 domain-containing protein [Mesorhizobium sp. SP-1A]|uniref:DUF192 domain-containing protein n=1 Tax=Mesorhizobium sp. SP-1A TaxID=3077840 RepID=UPI0028F70ECA|nr:DUF192 domain-containing protein [Mesorhizobium sp. SP-1A]